MSETNWTPEDVAEALRNIVRDLESGRRPFVFQKNRDAARAALRKAGIE